MKLQDKVIFVTGAAKGIGGTTAKILAGYGAKIIAVDMMEDRVKQTAEEIKAAGIRSKPPFRRGWTLSVKSTACSTPPAWTGCAASWT